MLDGLIKNTTYTGNMSVLSFDSYPQKVCGAGDCRHGSDSMMMFDYLGGDDFTSGCHTEFAVLDSTGPDQFVSKGLHNMCLALDDEDLETIMMIQVNMQYSADLSIERMLEMCQFTTQIASMMIVDDTQGADGFLISCPLLVNQVITNQVPDCFRAIGITLLMDSLVKTFQQTVLDGYTKTNQLSHFFVHLKILISTSNTN